MRSITAAFIAMILSGLVAYSAPVGAQPGEQPPPPQPIIGPTIAVMPFEDAAIGGDMGWVWRSRRYAAGAGIADMIAGELAAQAERWRSFQVVERQRLFEVLDEQDLGTGGRIDPATAARVGRIVGADLLLMGAVARFDVRDDWVGLPWDVGFDAERHLATVVFEARLVDSTSARVVTHARGRGTDTCFGARLRRGDLAGLDIGSRHFAESLLGGAAREAARSLTREMSAEIDRIAGPAAEWLVDADAIVVYVDAGRVMLNRGGPDGVEVGDVFIVRRKRQDIFDPITGELLKTIYDDLGRVEIDRVEEKVASGPFEPAPNAPGPPQPGDFAEPAVAP